MKTLYSFEIPKEDEELTHIGPATPCGELLRRYWQPVCLSDELKDLPKRIRILGEDLVAFRDRSGRPGVLFFRCSHRGTSLEYGRIEDRGIRCCYHGWLYDVEGSVLEMPLEPAKSTFKDRVKHPCYPVKEFGGLVFAYMGPPDKMPLFPKFDVWMQEGGTLKATIGMRSGGAANCNWLQTQENEMDPLHITWLHTRSSSPQFISDAWGIAPELEYEETDMGMKCMMTRRLPDGRTWVVTFEVIMPFECQLVYTDEPRPGRMNRVSWTIPVDDTHQMAASITWVPTGGESPEEKRRRVHKSRPFMISERTYEETQRCPDDKEAQEGQGLIAIHALEHLATSDRGVIMFRKILREGIMAVREGRDPKGIIRDPNKAKCIATNAGSVVREAAKP